MTGGRATSIAQLETILGRLITPASFMAGLAFAPRPSDVIISPFAKCGTTWLQQIVHGLRTRGDMTFDEITAVTPWLEMAADVGWSLEAEQVGKFRAYKSHLPWDKIPKGGRYICTLRDPGAALRSMYHFFEGWLFEPGTIGFEDFARQHFLQRQAPSDYWYHLLSWWQQRDNPAVLLLSYEQLIRDFDNQLQRIADFLGVQLDQELRTVVTLQSGKQFMLDHDKQFDDHLLRSARGQALGLSAEGTVGKVRKDSGPSVQLTPALSAALAQRWQADITAVTGLRDYAELEHQLTLSGRQ